MKRLISALISGTMLVCALGGCTGKDASSDTNGGLVQSDGSAKITITDGRFTVGGKPLWLCGTNTPWDNWDDFGGNFDAEFWDTHFAALHEAGINSSRVWILCSGDKGIQFDDSGMVTGMTEQFWQDTDQLMAIAAKHQIYIMATMMSFDCCKNGNRNNKKFRAMIQDEAKTESYVQNYIIPFAKRYDSNDYLFSIDLCNEPDWIHENDDCGKLDWEPLTIFFGKCAQGIHANSDILVTTGIGYIPNNSDSCGTDYVGDLMLRTYVGEGAQMDFNSVHYYAWMRQWYGSPFSVSPETFGLDPKKPAVLGEVSAKGSPQEKMDLTQCAESVYHNGWDGIFPWTSTGTDDNGGFDEVTAYSKYMLTKIDSLIFPLGKN